MSLAFNLGGINYGMTAGYPHMTMPSMSSGASAPLQAALKSYGSNNAPMALNGSVGADGGINGITPQFGQPVGLGFNMPTANLLLGGLQTIGSLWNAWEQRKMAQEQFNYKKEITESNLKNQIQSYNTTLEDRSRSRAFTEGQDAATAQAYIDKNRLSR
jgi:hypothetical protein